MLGSAGVIPSAEKVYEWQFKWIVPLGIILMLLAFQPKYLLKLDKDFLICFIIGAIATSIGGIIAGLIFKNILPQDYWRISAQLTGSFIGGYENAVSIGSELKTPTGVFLQAFAGDSVLTTIWIIINVLQARSITPTQKTQNVKFHPDTEIIGSLDVTSMSITIAVTCVVMLLSSFIYQYVPAVPKILWASLIATLITFTPLKQRFSGSYVFGSFLLSFFIFGCGAVSDVPQLFHNANILLFFPALIVCIHAVILFSIAKILKIKKEIVIIASQSLIGGPATTLTVVTARKWDYQFEAITLGLLGYAVGNYFGFIVGWILK